MPTKLKIAREYYPDSVSDRNAVRRLRADIVRCQELHQRLLNSNPKFDKVHFVTYREQRLIWEYLGDP